MPGRFMALPHWIAAVVIAESGGGRTAAARRGACREKGRDLVFRHTHRYPAAKDIIVIIKSCWTIRELLRRRKGDDKECDV